MRSIPKRGDTLAPSPTQILSSGSNLPQLENQISEEFEKSSQESRNPLKQKTMEKAVFDNFQKHNEVDINQEYDEKEEIAREKKIYGRRGKYEEYIDKSNSQVDNLF